MRRRRRPSRDRHHAQRRARGRPVAELRRSHGAHQTDGGWRRDVRDEATRPHVDCTALAGRERDGVRGDRVRRYSTGRRGRSRCCGLPRACTWRCPASASGTRTRSPSCHRSHGRVMFGAPWGDLSYIGTTDTRRDAFTRRAARYGTRRHYLLRSGQRIFPHARTSLRGTLSPVGRCDPCCDRPEVGAVGGLARAAPGESPSGLLTIAGGKLTRTRHGPRRGGPSRGPLARAGWPSPRSRAPTDRCLPGGETAAWKDSSRRRWSGGRRSGRPHLVAAYGSDQPQFSTWWTATRALGRPSSPGGRPLGPR